MLTTSYLPKIGGIEVAVDRLSTELVRQGHDVHVLVQSRFLGSLYKRLFRRRPTGLVPVHYFVYYFDGVHPMTEANDKAVATIAHLAKRYRLDVLHTWGALPCGYLAMRAKALTRVKTLVLLTFQDIHDPFLKLQPVWTERIPKVLRSADRIVSCAPDQKNRVQQDVPGQNIGVIPHGTRTDVFTPDRRSEELRRKLCPEGGPFLFSLQRLHRRKGVDVQIRAMLHVREEFPNARLIIGGTGAESPQLETLIEQLGLAETVRLIGFISNEDLPAYYASCDLFVFHSHYEAFGIVLAEAMACGAPIVSTLAGAIPQVVENSVQGVLVRPGDPEAIGEAIIQLLHDPERLAGMGKAGRVKAVSEYNWTHVARRYVAEYEGLIETGNMDNE